MMTQTHQAALDRLRQGFTGDIIVPDDPAYDEARTIFNAMIDKRPFGVATSFTFRLHELPTVTVMLLLWPPAAGPEVVRAYRDFMESAPDEVGGGALYLNFIGDEGENRVVAGFGRGNYQRLAQVKAQYDPDNVFLLNHNIKPASLTPANRAPLRSRWGAGWLFGNHPMMG